jgi:apolipoprotein N-acyltransferase
MSRTAAKTFVPDLLVWPESALTFFLGHEPHYLAAIGNLLRPIGADLVVGAPHQEDRGARYYNSAFYVTADGRLTGRYDKNHLLPFAEYFPLRFIGLLRRNFERVRYFTPGDGRTLLQTRAGPAAVVICFEAIFPEIVREQTRAGATMLLNLSNDVWLGHGVGQAQHLAMVALRAVENRLWVVRATTTGMSAIIDPVGRVRTQSALDKQAVLNGTIAPLHVGTFYKRFGDVFAYACVAAACALMVAVTRRR